MAGKFSGEGAVNLEAVNPNPRCSNLESASGGRRQLAVLPGDGRTPPPRQACVDEFCRRPPGSASFLPHVRGLFEVRFGTCVET